MRNKKENNIESNSDGVIKPKNKFNFIKFIFYFAFTAILISTIIVVLSLILTIIDKQTYKLDLCLTDSCLEYTKTIFGNVIKLFFSLMSVIGSLITFSGIYIAVKTYINNVNSNALSNHIAHLKIFQDYISNELGKYDHLHISAFDIYGWYNNIFQKSIKGNIDVSDSYKEKINSIENQILTSNRKSKSSQNGPFLYKEHQKEMNRILNDFGIKMSFHPRNDYFEIEGQVIRIIESVNKAFCGASEIQPFTIREYI